MNRKFIIVFLCVLAFCWSCRPQVALDNSTVIPLVSYAERQFTSPDEVYGVEPRYIKLCDTADFAFQNIGKVVVRNNNIYISDGRGLKLVVFDERGLPLSLMDFAGRGPREYLSISDFDVDSNGMIWVVDGRKKVFFKYGQNCSLLQSFSFTYDIDKVHCLRDGFFLFQIASWDVSSYSGTMLAKADSSLMISKQILMYPDNKDDNFVFHSIISQGDTSVFFLEPPDYHLYELNEYGEVNTVYRADYGDYMIPEKFRGDLERYYGKSDNGYYILCNSYRVTDNYFTFGVTKGPHWSSAIVNRKSRVIAYFDNMESGFKLVGQSSEGSVWLLSEGNGFDMLPADVQCWMQEGKTVLAIYPDK